MLNLSMLKGSLPVWVSVAGAVLPSLPNLAFKWLASDSSVVLVSVEQENWIRALWLLIAVPLACVWQPSLPARE